MAENKTQRTRASVTAFLNALPDPVARKQAKQLAALMRRATGKTPAMWGTAIVGYGDTTYTGSNGRQVDWFPVGFSPRKAALTLYLMGGARAQGDLLKRLGRHKVGGGCLYIPDLDAVDPDVLVEMIQSAYRQNTAPASRAKTSKASTRTRA